MALSDIVNAAVLVKAEVEAGTFASSFIPTAGATVTRNADVLTYPFAGNADATQGTAYAELGAEWSVASGTAYAIASSAAGGAGRQFYVNNADASTVIRMFDGTAAASKTGLTSTATASRKRGSSWGAGGQAITGDGAAVATAAFDGTMASTAIAIGCSTDGLGQWFGPIKNVAIYEQQFTNTQIQEMTA